MNRYIARLLCSQRHALAAITAEFADDRTACALGDTLQRRYNDAVAIGAARARCPQCGSVELAIETTRIRPVTVQDALNHIERGGESVMEIAARQTIH